MQDTSSTTAESAAVTGAARIDLDKSLEEIISNKKKGTKSAAGKLSKKKKQKVDKSAPKPISNPVDLLDKSLGDIIKERKDLVIKNRKKSAPKKIVLQPAKLKMERRMSEASTNSGNGTYRPLFVPKIYDVDAPKIQAVKISFDNDLLAALPKKHKLLTAVKRKPVDSLA